MGNHITSCLVCTRVFRLYFLSIALPHIHSLHFVYTGTKSVYVYQCLSKISRIAETDVQQAGQTFLGAVFIVCIIKFLLQYTDFYQFPLAFSCLLQAEVHTNHLPCSDISNQVPFSSCSQKGSRQKSLKTMILRVINRRMQQWFCKCLSGRRCFKQGNGNFAATLLSVL